MNNDPETEHLNGDGYKKDNSALEEGPEVISCCCCFPVKCGFITLAVFNILYEISAIY